MVDFAIVNRDSPIALFVSPPVYDFALFDLFLKPYGLLRLAGWLASAGWSVRFIDCLDYRDSMTLKSMKSPRRRSNGTGKFFRFPAAKPNALHEVPRRFARYGIETGSFMEQLRRLSAEPVSVVFVGSGMTYWYIGLKEVVEGVRSFFPTAKVVVGGVYATLCPEHCRKVIQPDYVVVGNAYPELSKILEKLKLICPPHPPGDDLFLQSANLQDAAPVRLNNGCPYRCDYCASHLICGDFIPGDPESCFRSVREIHRTLGTTQFAFYDDALLVNKGKALLPFLELVIESALPLSFFTPNGLHVREIDSDLARLMKKAGFEDIRLGFESGSENFHRRFGGKMEVSMMSRCIEVLRDAGFQRVTTYVLAGLPGQFAGEVEESIRYISRFGVRIEIAGYSPIPGSPLWQKSVRLSRYPLEEEPLTHNNSIHPMEWRGFTRADMKRLKTLAKDLSAVV